MSEGRAKLLDHQPIPVRTDVVLHGLADYTLGHLRQAMEQGLTPVGLEIINGLPILRFERPKPRLLAKGGGTA